MTDSRRADRGTSAAKKPRKPGAKPKSSKTAPATKARAAAPEEAAILAPAGRSKRARWGALLGGAAASAALLGLYSQVEMPWHLLGFVALVPWLLGLSYAASWLETVAAGCAMSFAFVVAVFPWLPAATERYAHAPSSLATWLPAIAIAPFIEPQFVVVAVVLRLARARAGGEPLFPTATIAAACAYVATELLVPKLFFDTLGQGLHPAVALRQAADIAGVHGLTLLLLLVNQGVAATVREWRGAFGGRFPRSFWVSVGALALAHAYGFVRYRQIEGRARSREITVGLVQANIASYDALRAERGAYGAVRAVLDAHYALSDELRARGDLDLLVWPETVYPTTFHSPKNDVGAELDAEVDAFVAKRGIPLIFGAYERDAQGEYNAAFVLAPKDAGSPSAQAYRKRMLFPLTEWVPGILDSEWLRRELPWTGHWQRGPGPRSIEVPLRRGGPIRIVPLICYDVLFPDFVADAAVAGAGRADLIVTISNDSWFPDARAPRLHLISAAFRSIETRLPQVRATNSGISAVISPTGEITASTSWATENALLGKVALYPPTGSPLLAAGPRFGTVLFALTFLVVLRIRRENS